jgi:hypothetical protein
MDTGVPEAACSPEVRGMDLPTCWCAQLVSPEQSKAFGPAAPQEYGSALLGHRGVGDLLADAVRGGDRRRFTAQGLCGDLAGRREEGVHVHVLLGEVHGLVRNIDADVGVRNLAR